MRSPCAGGRKRFEFSIDVLIILRKYRYPSYASMSADATSLPSLPSEIAVVAVREGGKASMKEDVVHPQDCISRLYLLISMACGAK